jgi:hypothetical protein
MCGNLLEPEDFAGGRVTCPACGTEVAEGFGRLVMVDPEAARQKVRGPAIGLMAAGALLVLSGVAGPAMVGGMFAFQPMPANAPEERSMMIVMLVGLGLTGLAALGCGGTVIFAGYRMIYLRSWGLAVTGSILAITASVLALVSCFGCCVSGVIGVPVMPLGIWALVVLNDANVRGAFR